MAFQTSAILRAWGRILTGRRPSLSIEITRECPLRCPGCYAYEPQHLGGGPTLRQLRDYKGQELVDKVLELVDLHRPLHLSLVGGDPLVRHRELDVLLPRLFERNIHVQIVTSAFRPLGAEWRRMPLLNVSVSIDGLQPEHDARRAPATYERILRNIAGQRVTVHCTITGQMMNRAGYLEEFLEFWTPREEIKQVWFSMFTPQRGDDLPEMLTPEQRAQAIADLRALRRRFPKLAMLPGVIDQFTEPPTSPTDCIFAQTTRTISADLRTEIGPCQFGGDPDCNSCGCMASMGLAAVGKYRIGGFVSVDSVFRASIRAGRMWSKPAPVPRSVPELRVIGQRAAQSD